MVSALRSRVEDVRRAELDRQRAKRSDLDEAQWEQVDAVTRAMVAKLLHQPSVTLKEAAGTPRGERLVESLRTLFDL
jgi:glutamyl-tRNA reductase